MLKAGVEQQPGGPCPMHRKGGTLLAKLPRVLVTQFPHLGPVLRVSLACSHWSSRPAFTRWEGEETPGSLGCCGHHLVQSVLLYMSAFAQGRAGLLGPLYHGPSITALCAASGRKSTAHTPSLRLEGLVECQELCAGCFPQ